MSPIQNVIKINPVMKRNNALFKILFLRILNFRKSFDFKEDLYIIAIPVPARTTNVADALPSKKLKIELTK